MPGPKPKTRKPLKGKWLTRKAGCCGPLITGSHPGLPYPLKATLPRHTQLIPNPRHPSGPHTKPPPLPPVPIRSPLSHCHRVEPPPTPTLFNALRVRASKQVQPSRSDRVPLFQWEVRPSRPAPSPSPSNSTIPAAVTVTNGLKVPIPAAGLEAPVQRHLLQFCAPSAIGTLVSS
jgi:hypothetical protein